jgi:hypothetical protein
MSSPIPPLETSSADSPVIPKRKTLVKILTAYVSLAVIYPMVVYSVTDSTKAGIFGDTFGAFNAFFAGLAFLGVIYTILLQTKQLDIQSQELRLQRQELEQTRAELSRSADAQERTERVLSAQLRSARMSAQLAAIPLLIEEEIQHLKAHHSQDIPGVGNFEAMTDHQIGRLIAKVEEQISISSQLKGPHADHLRCMHGNLRDLQRYRAEMKSIYRELREPILAEKSVLPS